MFEFDICYICIVWTYIPVRFRMPHNDWPIAGTKPTVSSRRKRVLAMRVWVNLVLVEILECLRCSFRAGCHLQFG